MLSIYKTTVGRFHYLFYIVSFSGIIYYAPEDTFWFTVIIYLHLVYLTFANILAWYGAHLYQVEYSVCTDEDNELAPIVHTASERRDLTKLLYLTGLNATPLCVLGTIASFYLWSTLLLLNALLAVYIPYTAQPYIAKKKNK